MNSDLFRIKGQLHQALRKQGSLCLLTQGPSQRRENHRDNHQRMQDRQDCISTLVLSLTVSYMLLPLGFMKEGIPDGPWTPLGHFPLETHTTLSHWERRWVFAAVLEHCSVSSGLLEAFIFQHSFGHPQTPPFSRVTTELICSPTKTMCIPHTRMKCVTFEGMFCLELSLFVPFISHWMKWMKPVSHCFRTFTESSFFVADELLNRSVETFFWFKNNIYCDIMLLRSPSWKWA